MTSRRCTDRESNALHPDDLRRPSRRSGSGRVAAHLTARFQRIAVARIQLRRVKLTAACDRECATVCYMEVRTAKTRQVGVRELRQNLSVHLRRVLRGETLEVTDRGHAVAILAPLPNKLSVLDRLEADGRLIRAKGDLLALKGPRIRAPRPTAEMLDEERADRI